MTSTSPPPQAVEEAGDMGNDDFVLRLQPKHKAALRNYWVRIVISLECYMWEAFANAVVRV